MFRLYPAVATIHGPIAAAEELVRREALDWRHVREIRVGVTETTPEHGGSIVHPTDGISAQFSLAYSIALALVRGRNVPQDYFDPDSWRDPDLAAVSDLIRAEPMAIPEGDPILSARVEIDLDDGRTLSYYQRGFPGHPVQPATPRRLLARFERNVEGGLSSAAARRLVATIDAVDDLDDIGALTSQLGVTDRF